MPEASRTPTSQFKQGNSLEWGQAAQLNDAIGLVPPPEEDNFTPQGDAESFLFSPTDRPHEPFSAGQPFGDGPNATAASFESDEQLVARVAKQIHTDPSAPAALKKFANRAFEGQ